MRKITGILAVVAAILVLSSCGKKVRPFDYGTWEGTKYSNSYFGFSLELPADWYVMSFEEMSAAQKLGAEAISNEGMRNEIQKNARGIRDAGLVRAFESRPGTQQGFNANFQALVENVSKHANIRDGAQYLTMLVENLKVSGMGYYDLDDTVTSVEIGGERFAVVSVGLRYMGFDITQDYYAALRDGFVLAFIATYADKQQGQVIENVLGSVAFE